MENTIDMDTLRMMLRKYADSLVDVQIELPFMAIEARIKINNAVTFLNDLASERITIKDK